MEPGVSRLDEGPKEQRQKQRVNPYISTFEVEGRVYRELRSGFENWSDSAFPEMFGIRGGQTIGGRVGTDENPIRLSGCTASEFESLLEVMYPADQQVPTLNKDEWIGVLKLARLWNMPQLAVMAVDKATSYLAPIEKITMGKATAHRVPRWTREGYTAVIGNLGEITLEGLAAEVGWETTARILWGLKKASFELYPSLVKLAVNDVVDKIVEEEFGTEELEATSGLHQINHDDVPHEAIPSRPPTTVVITQEQPVPRRLGMASIISFTPDGVYVSSMYGQPRRVIENFAYDRWRVEKHVRLVGDTTGAGRSDVIGFGNAGVYVSRHTADNIFAPVELVLRNFGYNTGWRVDRHVRYAVDLRNRGYVDLIGFGNAGVYVALNDGKGGFTAPKLVLPEFGYDNGWRVERHLRFLADLTGNGLPDIVGFGEVSVSVALNNGDGTFQNAKVTLNNFSAFAGWEIDKHPRTLADLTGDGRPDIVGFFNNGVHVAFNAGDGTFHPPKLVLKDLGYSQGWRVETHPRFVADITGDGRGDIIGFASSQVVAALNNGDGTFQPVKPLVQDFGESRGYRVGRHLRLPVDFTGNGAADIIGFGNNAVWVSYNDGKGNFAPVQKLGEYPPGDSDSHGVDKTVRFVTNLYT